REMSGDPRTTRHGKDEALFLRWLRLKKPIPRRRLLVQVFAAGELLPGQQHLGQANAAKACPAQAVADLERLPEMLLQAAEAKLAEGEVIAGVVVVVGRVLASRVQRQAVGQGAVDQQPRVIT